MSEIIVARRHDDDRRGQDGYFFGAQGLPAAQGFFAAQGLPAAQGFFFAAAFFAAGGLAFAAQGLADFGAQGLADFGAQGLLCAKAGPARPRANALTRAIWSDLFRIVMVIPPLVIVDRREMVAIPRKA